MTYVRVTNTDDDSFFGDLSRFFGWKSDFGTNRVQVDFTAKVETANGVYQGSFSIKGDLPLGGWISVPMGEFSGPGTVTITAANPTAYSTSVTVGAYRLPPQPP
jgi:hypothetical protein